MKPTLAFVLLSSLSGCFWATTKSEGESLRKDVTELQTGLGSKQKELDGQLAQLKQVLDDATKLLKRNSADLGQDVERLRNDLHAASGLVAAMNNSVNELKTSFDAYKKSTDQKIDSMDTRLAQLESGKPSAQSSPDDLWRLGSQAFEAGRYNDAIDIFKRLHTTYPTHERADDAIYFKGQAYGKLKEWDKAIGAYQQLAEKFPDGPLTDDGYYFAALAAQQLKQCSEARAYLNLVKTKFPKSNVMKESNELDAALKKDLKNKAKCSS